MQIRLELQQGLSAGKRPVEIVERKGLGHPDTICDMLSEQFSVALSKHYLDRFGLVLHHNVDKALLAAGRSEPAFGGGRIIEPIDIFLSGRATHDVRGTGVPVHELAVTSARSWFQRNMHALDPATGVRFHCLVRPGSPELVDLFMRQRDQGVFLANDTSCGTGFAPLTALERIVLAVERKLNSREFKTEWPETGEDIKVMGVREDDSIALTVSCAFIGRFLKNIAAYNDAKDRLRRVALEIAEAIAGRDVAVCVNTADSVAIGSVFLTVNGTSAESGDDGQTGRGNRANGLITPCRPMTLEAMAGKNPVTHVGKLYNAAASRLAAAIVAEVPGITEAECFLVSQIGSPVDRPRIAHLRVWYSERVLSVATEDDVRAVAEREIASIPLLWKSFLTEATSVA
ncbi:MAG: methionine adenosyltransferase [Hyphomicrobiaceae bacterium]